MTRRRRLRGREDTKRQYPVDVTSRILFCTDTYPPQLNGVSVVTAAMVAGLCSRGWECAVVAPAYPTASRRVLEEPRGVPRFDLPSYAVPAYPELRLVWPQRGEVGALMDRFRPDVVHCATEMLVGRAGLSEANRRGIPVCTTYHTDFSRYCSAYGMPFLRPAVRTWIRRFHAQAARTFVPSRAAQRDLANMGVPRSLVWSGGVDTEQFHPRHFSVLTRHRYAMGPDFTFLHVGRMAPEKNIELLLTAFELLRARHPERRLRLLVAGSGPSEVSLRLRAGNGVTFLGAVERSRDLPALYASSDAFVTCSETETLGLVVLEAMAAGLPVVACHAGGVGDYLESGRNGLSFAIGDLEQCVAAMERLMSDCSLYERLRVGARATAEHMSARCEMNRLDALLRRVAGAAVPRHRSLTPALMSPAR